MTKRIIIHKQRYIEHPKGGTINTTLCGRIGNYLSDGTNVSEDYGKVTCRFCLNQMYYRDLISEKEYLERKNK